LKRGYGQYCPLALAAELLCERWTLLVISRLIDGCAQFNEIHRGVPRISPAMLTKRLRELQHAGLVKSTPSRRGTPRTYVVTEAGQELAPLIDSLAIWGQHWARDMCLDDLDPGFLAWSMHMSLETRRMPPGRTVLGFEFSNAPRDCRRFWLVNEDGDVDMCLKDPGYEVDVYDIDARDPMVFVGSAVGLAAIALAGYLVPASRASRVEPVVALRSE
jgi:DNA-binding HxlR family transcriptional regulator